MFVNNTYSQSINNGLFIIVDKTSDSIYQNEKTNTRIRYSHDNKKQNWSMLLDHVSIPDSKKNHFIYKLPIETIEDLEKRGRIKKMGSFVQELNKLNVVKLNLFFNLHYSYYYEYLERSRYKSYRRYNIFLVFKSDLENSNLYVPCYEVSLTTIKMVQQ
jgi:hypothetical protein